MRGCAKQLLECRLAGSVRCSAFALGVAVGLCGIALPASAKSDTGFQVQHASTKLHDGVYRLDAEFDLALPERPREALASGTPVSCPSPRYSATVELARLGIPSECVSRW